LLSTEAIVLGAVALVVGGIVGFLVVRLADRMRAATAKRMASQILEQSKQEAENIRRTAELESKDELIRRREEFDREANNTRNELREHERRLEKKEETLTQKHQLLHKKDRALELTQKKLLERREQLQKRAKQVEDLVTQQTDELQKISGMTRENATTVLLERLEKELSTEFGARVQKHEERIRSTAEEKARAVLGTAIQRYAAGHTAETTVSSVDLPSDDMKGRIIGREGRNIRTFEKCTGVDVIVDDTPGVVVVSAFDNVRRETAKLALKKLIADGRIHPARIEEVVNQTKEEMEKHIMEVGRQAVQDSGIGMLSDKLVQLLGRLKFRTSYSQNVLQHSLEVCLLAGLMAEELGLDGQLARRCGLLHDVGKAADHEMEGGHPQIGADLAKRYGETKPEVLHAILCHHDDISVDHIYTVLVTSADAISASRPGARRETLEKYVRRMEELEKLASSFPGVDQVYAIQAGREVRVIANAGKTNDQDAHRISRDIARSIEQQLEYPGEIKVTVIREVRAVEYAK
jgi:ribonuclease Y